MSPQPRPVAGALRLRRDRRDLTTAAFIRMFCTANDCAPTRIVRRIEFEYVDGAEVKA